MTVALNYASAAVAGLKEKLPMFGSSDHQVISALIDQIGRSVHFSVPENGEIFSDGFRGLTGLDVRLPFPEITIGYHVSREETHPELTQVPRRLVVASMVRTEDLRARLKNHALPGGIESEHLIHVAAVSDFDNGRGWVPMAGVYCILSSGWDQYEGKVLLNGFHEGRGNAGIAGFPIVYLPDLATGYLRNLHYNEELFWKSLCNDVGAEAAVTMELCEALTCTNVDIATIQSVRPSVNERRTRDGKLPLYDIRTLEIVPRSSGKPEMAAAGYSCIDRASPRQHLRRGHIRRLDSGRNIWVSACSVGERGRIDKIYSVKSEARIMGARTS